MGNVTLEQAVQMAVDHHQAGRLAEAEGIYRQIIAVQPRQSDALHLLGVIAHQRGHQDEAAAFISRSLEEQPNNPSALSNLGLVRQALGQMEEAKACHQRATELQPDFADAHNNLGIVLQGLYRFDEALLSYERALALRPEFFKAHNNLGTLLLALRRHEKARWHLEHALALHPGYPEAHNNLGTVFIYTHQLDEARDCYTRALELQPNSANAHSGLSNVLRDLGEIDAAVLQCRASIALKPTSAWLQSNLIYALHFDPEATAAILRAECQRWEQQYAAPLRGASSPHTNEPDPARRLKVGYVSPDFRNHAIGFFLIPLLAAHDHARFEVHCYASVAQPDDWTAHQRALADVWHDVVRLSDEVLTEKIRADGIDILVDLSQHTASNRLPVFARRPAPVQVAWLGYPGSTGLSSIGYRLTDATVEPVGGDESWSSEEPVRLPDCWCCFDPLDEAPPVGELPALANHGKITFGSINGFAKHNEPLLRLWARVLAAVPGSRLRLRCPPGSTRDRVTRLFVDQEVGSDRLEFVWREPSRQDYLRLYQGIDIALDPSPYNGMTTTCDALWMGVPVLTLPGQLPGTRATLSLLTVLGLEELAARSEDELVRVAALWAADLPQLAAVRAGLRERMRGSPLMDGPRFARHVEEAYRTLWRRWCEKQGDQIVTSN